MAINDNGMLESYSLKTADSHKLMKDFSKANIRYTFCKLVEAGYVQVGSTTIGNEVYYNFRPADGITYEGHKFIDSVRDDSTWKKVLQFAKKNGGSIALTVIPSLVEKWLLQSS